MKLAVKRTRSNHSMGVSTVPARPGFRLGFDDQTGERMLDIDISGGRATFTINDPDRRNPLTDGVIEAMIDGLDSLTDEVRVVVITGAGDRAFCAGGDLSGGFFDDAIGSHRERSRLADLFRAMRRSDVPVIARVNGHALAGGFGLMLACDIAIGVEDASYGTPEVTVGLFPMMITTVMQRSLPPKVAMDLVLTGRRITAAEALEIGALSRVVPRDGLDQAVDELVADFQEKSRAVLAMGKHSFYAVQDLSFDAALDQLAAGLTSVTLTEDAREGLAAFVGKRTPRFQGR